MGGWYAPFPARTCLPGWNKMQMHRIEIQTRYSGPSGALAWIARASTDPGKKASNIKIAFLPGRFCWHASKAHSNTFRFPRNLVLVKDLLALCLGGMRTKDYDIHMTCKSSDIRGWQVGRRAWRTEKVFHQDCGMLCLDDVFVSRVVIYMKQRLAVLFWVLVYVRGCIFWCLRARSHTYMHACMHACTFLGTKCVPTCHMHSHAHILMQ